MYKYFIIIVIIILNTTILFAGEIIIGTCDTVISFHPGSGQNFGQSSPYFPNNVFGLPSRNANETVPETSFDEICSLGFDGEILISFKDIEIIDGIGPDFTIFENAFLNPINNKIFAEPAVVSVSYDGINYIDFPYNLLSLDGCAGTKPTYGDKNPFNPEESGGNSFDLSEIGINSIKYIKIKDITKIISDNPSHPFYDPTLSGFDLDAVVAINYKNIGNSDINNIVNEDFKILSNNHYIIIVNNIFKKYHINLYNLNGNKIYEKNITTNHFQIYLKLTLGIYFIEISDNEKNYHKKIIIQ